MSSGSQGAHWSGGALRDSQLQVIIPAPRQQWSNMLDRDPNATIFQTPEWLDAMCRSEGYEDASRLYETADGRQFILPLVRRRLFRAFSVEESMPGAWGMGGLVAAEQADTDDMRMIWSDLQWNAPARLRIRDCNVGRGAPTDNDSQHKVTVAWETKHVLDLRGGFEPVYANFTRSTKKTLRKAERAGLKVECDSSGRLVHIYYDLYLEWVRSRAAERNLPSWVMLRRARRRESLRKFQDMAESLGTSSKTWVAWFQDHPIAAKIGLSYKSRAFAFRGYSNHALANPLGANDVLHRYMIEDACRAGCTSYNLGGSGGVPGLEAYKAKLGGVATAFPVYTIESPAIKLLTQAVDSLASATRALAGHRQQRRATQAHERVKA